MPGPEGILRHIRHAEEWLRWARGDCRRGDMRSALLRLLLAEAEIRHARESTPEPRAAPHDAGGGEGARPSRLSVALLGAAVAVAIAAAGYAVSSTSRAHSGGPPAGASNARNAGEPAAVIQLESGGFLTLIPAPQPQDAAPAAGGAPVFDDRAGGRDRFPVVPERSPSTPAPASSGSPSSSF